MYVHYVKKYGISQWRKQTNIFTENKKPVYQ